MKIEFYRHSIDKNDIEKVNTVLKSIFITTGEVVKEFEHEFQICLDTKDVIGLTSGMSAPDKQNGLNRGRPNRAFRNYGFFIYDPY